jgi:hypothetical protein
VCIINIDASRQGLSYPAGPGLGERERGPLTLPRSCTICSHEQRLEIDKAIVDGEPLRKLAARTGTTLSALWRHRFHISETLAKAEEVTEKNIVLSVSARMQAVKRDTDELATKARREGDEKLLLRVLIRQEKQMQLEAGWANWADSVRKRLGIDDGTPTASHDYSVLTAEERTQLRGLLRKACKHDEAA